MYTSIPLHILKNQNLFMYIIKTPHLYIINSISVIFKTASSITRDKDINITRDKDININYCRDSLLNILLVYDPIEDHWVETDGINIWINVCKEYDNDLLYKTLLHEVLHVMIFIKDKSELSEYLEHKMMYVIDKTLI